MLNHITSRFQQFWARFQDKASRDAFVASQLKTSVAAQIVTMREDRGLTQQQLAEAAGMSQPRISLLEDPNYDKMTFSTLKRVASAFDVAVIVRFVAFSELLQWANTTSPEKLGAPSFKDDHPPEMKPDYQTESATSKPEVQTAEALNTANAIVASGLPATSLILEQGTKGLVVPSVAPTRGPFPSAPAIPEQQYASAPRGVAPPGSIEQSYLAVLGVPRSYPTNMRLELQSLAV